MRFSGKYQKYKGLTNQKRRVFLKRTYNPARLTKDKHAG